MADVTENGKSFTTNNHKLWDYIPTSQTIHQQHYSYNTKKGQHLSGRWTGNKVKKCLFVFLVFSCSVQ